MARLLLSFLLLLAPAASAAAEALHVGDPAPPFSLSDLYGRTVSLDYFDGHPAVIVFWSTTSRGSAALLNDFREYQERWGRDDLAIVAVNADGGRPGADARKSAREYADRMNVIFPVLLDTGGAMQAAYGVSELPTAVLVDAGGRVTSIERGAAPAQRSQLKQEILVAVAAGPGAPAAAASCTIARARSCTHVDERDPSASNPEVLAVRLCVCHGDVDAAQIMLSAVSKEGLLGLDLRFALAHMMLVKGSLEDSRRSFQLLRDHYPQEGWGEWGLGIVALAEGDAEEALGHFQAAHARGWIIPEAETAALKYLEGYWRVNRPAPREEQFLALFEELNSVRGCYRRVNQRA